MSDCSVVCIVFLFALFLCWGSFLNSFAYRLLFNKKINTKRSYCPHCFTTIAWYDLFPVLSFFVLRAKARCCNQPISFLYPSGELLTAISCTIIALAYPWYTAVAFICFVSLLIISFYTDAKDFTLLRVCTLYAVPIGLLCAFVNILPISFIESFVGAIFGYFLLWSIAYIYQLIRKVDGLGNGDPELLALIGSFCGISGCLTILFIASILGSLYGITVCSIKQNYTLSAKFPFGPFLIIATLLWLILQPFDLLYHQ